MYNKNMNVYENLKENLRKLRISEKLTQKQLSEKTKLPRANIGRYETGEVVPPYDVLVKLADYFDVSIDELLGRE